MAAVRVVALLVVTVMVVVLDPVRGTRLRAVNSTSPWGNSESPSEDKTWPWRLPQAAMTVLKDCLTSSSDTSSCVKAVALRALDRVVRKPREIHLGAGMVLVPDKPSAKATGRSLDETKPEATDEALGQKLISLLQGYSLRLRLPSARTIRSVLSDPFMSANSTIFTGRKRNSGFGQMLVLGSSLLPLKMSLLALLTGKALMLSTLAFAIPALRLLQQGGGLSGGGGGGGGGSGGSHHCH